MRKYIPFLVLAWFVAIGLSAKLQVDLQGGFAKSDRRQDTGPAPIRPECIAWSSMWGPNPCDGGSGVIPNGGGTSAGGQCIPPRAQNFNTASDFCPGGAWDRAKAAYFSCLARQQPARNSQTEGAVRVDSITVTAANVEGEVYFVEQGGSYKTKVNGSFPVNATFGAYYLPPNASNPIYIQNGGGEINVPNWQQGAEKTHQVPADYPIGDYVLTKLYVNSRDIVWTGRLTIRVVPTGTLGTSTGSESGSTESGVGVVQPTIFGKVTNLAGQGVANVDVFDNNRVLVSGSTPNWSSITPATPLSISFRDYDPIFIFGAIGPNTDAELCMVGSGFLPEMGLYLGGLGTFKIVGHTPTSGTLYLNANDNQYAPGWQTITSSTGEVGYFSRGEATTDFIFAYYNLEAGHGRIRPTRSCADGNTGPTYQSRSDQGTLKIGKTNANGEIVFDQQFINFLKTVSGSVALTNSNRTITLAAGAAIPTGLTTRYVSGTTRTTKNITVSNNRLDLSVTLNIGSPTPTVRPTTAPRINSFSPLTGGAGTVVSVRGSNFGSLSKAVIGGLTVGAASGTTSTVFKFAIPASLPVGAYRVQIISSTGQLSDYSPKLFTRTDSSTDPTVNLISPAKLKPGRAYNVTFYGTNMTDILNVEDSDVLSVDSSTIQNLSAFVGFKARLRIVVSSSAPDGLHYLTFLDNEGNSLSGPIVVAR